MGIFEQLKTALGKQQEDGCELTPEAKAFSERYAAHVEKASRQLRDRQARDRQKRHASQNN